MVNQNVSVNFSCKHEITYCKGMRGNIWHDSSCDASNTNALKQDKVYFTIFLSPYTHCRVKLQSVYEDKHKVKKKNLRPPDTAGFSMLLPSNNTLLQI